MPELPKLTSLRVSSARSIFVYPRPSSCIFISSSLLRKHKWSNRVDTLQTVVRRKDGTEADLLVGSIPERQKMGKVRMGIHQQEAVSKVTSTSQ